MFNWEEFKVTQNILSRLGSKYQSRWGQHHVQTRPQELPRWMELCRDDLGYLTLVDVTGIDHGAAGPRGHWFEVIYQLMSMGQHQRLNVHVHLDDGETIPKISGYYQNGDWMVREQGEMLGLSFAGETQGLLLPTGQQVYPLRKNGADTHFWPQEPAPTKPKLPYNPNKSEAPYPEESYVWQNFDTFSPETMGLFDWQLCFDPERVVDSRVGIGLNHQGLELALESRSWFQGAHLLDKIHLGAAPTYGVIWARTLEEMLGISLPERAQAIRLVMLELARIVEHLTVLAEVCLEIRLPEARLFIDGREKINELFEKYCGHRQGIGLVKVGGLRDDLPHGWIVEYQRTCERLKKSLPVIHNSLIGQRRFRDTLEVSPVPPQSILQWGVTGPTMRASGLNFDLRKSQPFYFYQDIDFDIPVGIYGTSYDRYLIRYEELFQSFRIVTQVLDNLPLGGILNDEYDLALPELQRKLSSDFPQDWHYCGIESPNGEAGAMLFSRDGQRPSRLKLKTPSFSICQALPAFLRGVTREQVRPNLASFGLRRYEIDR